MTCTGICYSECKSLLVMYYLKIDKTSLINVKQLTMFAHHQEYILKYLLPGSREFRIEN